MTLLTAAQVRTLAAELGLNPTKKLGQNFVIDPNTVRKIVRHAGVSSGEQILEIGPGLGSLTLGLLEVGAHVTAIEIDRRLAEMLPATIETMQPGAAARLRVLHIDALTVQGEQSMQFDQRVPELLVANLPYNVAVPILMRLLETLPSLRAGLVMVQAEVGQRIAAAPGNKQYGAPSAKAAWYGNWQLAGNVSRNVFWPAPGVDSTLVSFQKAAQPLGTERERVRTFALVNAAFASRRKMLRQSLRGALSGTSQKLETVADLIAAAGIDPTARAEQLHITDFFALARAAPAPRSFDPRID